MKDLLFTGKNKLRLLIATTNDKLFSECRNIIANINKSTCKTSMKFLPYSLKTYKMFADDYAKRWQTRGTSLKSLEVRAKDVGLMAGIPTIAIDDEVMYVEPIADVFTSIAPFIDTPKNICRRVQHALEEEPKRSRKAHIEQTVSLYVPSDKDMLTVTRELYGTINVCPEYPTSYLERGRFDTIFIPDGKDTVLSKILKWSDIGHIGGAYSMSTPLCHALKDICGFLTNRYQPF